ncbi:unnamed protein product [Spirodela intermedia]|uniref:Uncharacterized protein n=1 Tax=Spirodela intermedia TaxID=51605 RepID=A0A7I8JQW9_SPIIN|nr:unnamed protein product [Spirodela intermedia]CAA6672161.1 unnamed protein product [Spirodela intermedia]
MVSQGVERDHPPPPAPPAQPEKVLLTQPLSLDGGLAAEHQSPNIVQRLISLFKNVRPGTDLTHFQLPALFNMPKSQLQCYGETVYCVAEDMLRRCNKGKTSLERFTSVVAWSISTTRPPYSASPPSTPSSGRPTMSPKVSHHPPVAALHATDAEQEVELLWWQELVPRFTGTGIETQIQGKREVKLRSFGESYEMDAPSLVIKFLPVPSTEWGGNVSILCRETGLEADLCYYRSHLFLGLAPPPAPQVMLKDVHSGKVTVLYDAKECIFGLKTPPCGTHMAVEDRARQLAAERVATGMMWIPRFFHLERTKEGSWHCWPKHPAVPPAPIVVPS